MAQGGDTLLRVEHLTMRFGGLVAIDDLSFEARQGEITALIGPNGAGKTTVFNCITGFYKPSEGRLGLRHGDAAVWTRLDALTDSGERSLALGNGTLYQLAASKEQLVLRVIDRVLGRIRRMGTDAAGARREVRERILALVEPGVSELRQASSLFLADVASFPPAKRLLEQH